MWQTIRGHFDPRTADKVDFVYGAGHAEIVEKHGAVVVPREFGGSLAYEIPHVPRRLDDALAAKYAYVPTDVPGKSHGSVAIPASPGLGPVRSPKAR